MLMLMKKRIHLFSAISRLYGSQPGICSDAFFLEKDRGWFWREEIIEPAEP